MKAVGSRAEVWHGVAKHTSGGLTKAQLFQDKNGRIKSRKASSLAKRKQNLKKHGWGFVKGNFGAVRLEDVKKNRRSGRRSRRRSGRRSSGRRMRR